jgi:hypothetical protein
MLGDGRVGMEGATYRLLPALPMTNLAGVNAFGALTHWPLLCA